jgi:hypothetical protein
MNLHARNVAWLLPLILTACADKARLPQVQPFAPPVSTIAKPPVIHPQLDESVLTLPLEPIDTDADAILEEAAKPAIRHRRAPAKPSPEIADTSQPGATSAQPPATETADEVPAIGVLSSGDPASGSPSDVKLETANSITDTERGLKSLDRPLNGQEQKTASQIRQFIRQARRALGTGDVDGARTLAAKAKVLLGELSE